MKKLTLKLLALLFTLSIALPTAANASAATAPGKVTSLQAYGIDDDEINLKWKKSANADGYQVQIYSSGKWKVAGTTKKTFYEAENLLSAKQYKLRVRVYKLSGNKKVYGAYSSVITATTVPDKPDKLVVSAKTKTTVSLKWSKVTGATGYQVYIYSSTTGKFTKKASVKSNSLTVKGLKANKNYKFKVRAYFKVGTKAYFGDFTDAVSVKTLPLNSKQTTKPAVKLISKSEAISIALKRAGVSKKNVLNLKCELDNENRVQVYEVEFDYGRYEYEYTINAQSGKVLHAEKEINR